ncbi:ADP-ribose pyrophosphatase [Ktedonobacter sp. SOSP1-52]|uniref:NUDIX domain-containing protein n=1 Tax=Ktedonobacter sp. SOSP1-52 TaxID=2778366 RepID=UPI001915AAF9|nr:NUDIX hydrolase [Ktedonobacter sp. SOSP1-52]GHO69883.1 ADP-ribose pyrophosphatase [Ktedonobacter sp. SOSP1-52]
MRKVDIQQQRTTFDEKHFKIQEATLRFEKFNGQMSEPVQRLVFERGDSAAALLFNRDTQKVILINQFRYPTYEKGPGWLTEVVAGSINENEQPEACIRREIHEEIGYQVHDLTYIATFYVSPGGSSERIILYYAEVGNADQVAVGGGAAGEHEDIEQVELSLNELWSLLEQGKINDAKTLIAVQWLQRKQ